MISSEYINLYALHVYIETKLMDIENSQLFTKEDSVADSSEHDQVLDFHMVTFHEQS